MFNKLNLLFLERTSEINDVIQIKLIKSINFILLKNLKNEFL